MRRASDAFVCMLIAQIAQKINVHTNMPLPRQLISSMGGAAFQGRKPRVAWAGVPRKLQGPQKPEHM